MASVHKKLEKVRKPRVHIKYEVETEGALLEKELPFVVGVLGDFSGNPTEDLKPFGERSFVQIDKENFDAVMARMTPGLRIEVENTLSDQDETMRVNLAFSKLEDFEPAQVAAQVPALKKLLESRNQLRDLMAKADRSEDLETLLEDILQDNDAVRRLMDELGARDGGKA
ncbi:MAG: type VI secretion system contractile sheath small subunit [Paracoccus sp. (in: a-proteobacteria)]|uniref:type VI secretion system contractile sheath small subunit n=1 Tax=Paracoccus sp. TaxID=267 RepID=UPI0026E0076D|nr:type VI secretion system contractile sheath small subunit [Paracoccus sp. (in: a-proteobacteria)]MDO5611854.1 type VI secretion system contractile sheath small subunit [Paracoccus sp. (in: a-proteobacteria)]